MAALIPEIFKSIQRRLRNISDLYALGSRTDDRVELEKLARESYDALGKINQNLLRMIEIERSLNSANAFISSSEMRICRQLLKEIRELSGVENSPS
ncbi:hypothetical protein [Glaciimonas immobilis]|uniref:Uncharacterized protein n=1 Tax=Glaciimonas immobilis TaxID=728004 RepID=A0A840RY19_9BURK|nr:hypothetical protein [Glaciimonas immobilis]KAF3998370.1 hypothetical protein HAV38_09230 [Glaciimonas immobilis]MBB5201998.1 hypothetical protein [Glaciimonas immobilis]